VEEVAEIARRAEVGALLPVHHYPGRDAAGVRAFRSRLAALSGIEVLAGEEGETHRAG
jgi:ribonuclease BN (tRNA processing enzyme)